MSAPVMGIVGATKSYGPVDALRAVNLNVRRGEVHAIVGENGAGKSTLIGIAAGTVPPDFVVVRVGGKEVKKPIAKKPRRAGLSVTFQHPELAEDLTVLENLQIASPELAGWGGWAEAERLLASVATERHMVSPGARVRDLTLAQQHVVELAQALATKPKVLMLDEPTEPFQREDVEKLFDLIKRLREEGVGIVYVSHRLRGIEELADHITVLRGGRGIDSRPARRITTDQIVTMIAGRPLPLTWGFRRRTPPFLEMTPQRHGRSRHRGAAGYMASRTLNNQGRRKKGRGGQTTAEMIRNPRALVT